MEFEANNPRRPVSVLRPFRAGIPPARRRGFILEKEGDRDEND